MPKITIYILKQGNIKLPQNYLAGFMKNKHKMDVFDLKAPFSTFF
jgi:hypothetical protein